MATSTRDSAAPCGDKDPPPLEHGDASDDAAETSDVAEASGLPPRYHGDDAYAQAFAKLLRQLLRPRVRHQDMTVLTPQEEKRGERDDVQSQEQFQEQFQEELELNGKEPTRPPAS